MNQAGGKRDAWGSKLGFVLAAAGSAIGLGNIWKFPYITGENGGGLFVLIYLGCIALVGMPIMAAEIMIGRAARKQPVGAFRELEGRPTAWSVVGWLGVIGGFIILSYYAVVAGWAIDYTLKSVVHFVEPIHEQAEGSAMQYRGETSLEEMRSTLVAERVKRESRDQVDQIRRRAPRSFHETYERYTAAISASSDPASARTKLFENDDRRRQIEVIEGLNTEVDAVIAAETAAATEFYSTWKPEEIRDAAEDHHRRRQTFETVQSRFLDIYQDGWTSFFWSSLFMMMTILVVSAGISQGIERWCKVLMPALLAIIVFMVVYAAFQPGFAAAARFVFEPAAHRLQPSGVLEALGHAFFTLSLGMGALITYGSYQNSKENLLKQSLVIAGLDTAIALLACLMMFPIIFSYGGEATAGPGLVFISMPVAFAEMSSGGMLLSILFFGLLLFAALTSGISLLEVVASYFIDERGWSRRKAAWILGGAIVLFSGFSAFAADPDFALTSWESGYGKNFFDTMDYLVSNWFLPVGGLLIAIYAGWFLQRRFVKQEFEGVTPVVVSAWLLLIRFVAPILVIIVLLQKIGVLDADELFYRP